MYQESGEYIFILDSQCYMLLFKGHTKEDKGSKLKCLGSHLGDKNEWGGLQISVNHSELDSGSQAKESALFFRPAEFLLCGNVDAVFSRASNFKDVSEFIIFMWKLPNTVLANYIIFKPIFNQSTKKSVGLIYQEANNNFMQCQCHQLYFYI